MFKLRKIHKYAGIFSGVVLILLSISGFFLNHDNWKFLYTTTFSNSYLPETTIKYNQRLYNSYKVDIKDSSVRLYVGFRGVYRSENGGQDYTQVSSIPFYDVVQNKNGDYYGATTEGVYLSVDKGKHWRPWALKERVITSISVNENKVLVAVDKKELYLLDMNGKHIQQGVVRIKQELLKQDIRLSRLIRDVHYGRGIFDDGLSLLWNDLVAGWLIILAFTGYLLWYLIRNIRYDKTYKKPLSLFLKIHRSSVVLLTVIPLVLLGITGILLDHNNFFAKFLAQTTVSKEILPPIYRSLKEDIWSIDYKDGEYMIGNRYGVYRSSNMKDWSLVSKGFAYRMMRYKGTLVVSGMGSANRYYKDNKWHILKNTPHMFRSVNSINNQDHYFAFSTKEIVLPMVKSTSLYTILLSIHDGSFFAPWWVFINDIASILLIVLLITGLTLWWKKIRPKLYRSLKKQKGLNN